MMPKCCLTSLYSHSTYHTPPSVASYLVSADAVGLIDKFWPVGKVLRIYFIDGTRDEKDLVLKTAQIWSKYGNIHFQEVDEWEDGSSDLRISMDPRLGSWSYIGKDNEMIHWTKPTMNFGWLDVATILHEFGHAIGLLHEHQNPIGGGFNWNKEQVVKDLSGPPNNWPKDRIDWNMFHMYDRHLIRGTELNLTSIMMYFFEASWTKDGKATPQNTELSQMDKTFINEVYPYNDPPEPPQANKFKEILKEAIPEARYMNRMRHHTLKVFANHLDINTQVHKSRKRLKQAIYEKLH